MTKMTNLGKIQVSFVEKELYKQTYKLRTALQSTVHHPECESTSWTCPELCDCSKGRRFLRKKRNLCFHTAAVWSLAVSVSDLVSGFEYSVSKKNIKERIQRLDNQAQILKRASTLHETRNDELLFKLITQIREALRIIIYKYNTGKYNNGDVKRYDRIIQHIKGVCNFRVKEAK